MNDISFYKVKCYTNNISKENSECLVSTLWGAYHLFGYMYCETSSGDCVILYDPMDRIMEYKINEGEIIRNNIYHERKVIIKKV